MGYLDPILSSWVPIIRNSKNEFQREMMSGLTKQAELFFGEQVFGEGQKVTVCFLGHGGILAWSGKLILDNLIASLSVSYDKGSQNPFQAEAQKKSNFQKEIPSNVCTLLLVDKTVNERDVRALFRCLTPKEKPRSKTTLTAFHQDYIFLQRVNHLLRNFEYEIKQVFGKETGFPPDDETKNKLQPIRKFLENGDNHEYWKKWFKKTEEGQIGPPKFEVLHELFNKYYTGENKGRITAADLKKKAANLFKHRFYDRSQYNILMNFYNEKPKKRIFTSHRVNPAPKRMTG